MLTEPCPCESGQSYQTCCYPLHEGALANNARTLMRSRYTAYVFSLAQYLLDTWHIDTRPDTLNLEEDAITKWLGLSIKRFEQPSDTSAIVEFVARYKIGGQKAERLHEVSQFILTDRWYYVSCELK